MTKKEFIDQYVVNFLSSYMAQRYDSDCKNGHVGEPYDNQPVEDALFFAERAWDSVVCYYE